MTQPFVEGDPRIPAHPYFQKRYGVKMPVWAMNMRFFSADAPFDPIMPTSPINLTAAVIGGPEPVGSVMFIEISSTWSGDPTPVITQQWKRNGVDIAGATGVTYTTVVADAATTLTLVETATSLGGVARATSNEIVIV